MRMLQREAAVLLSIIALTTLLGCSDEGDPVDPGIDGPGDAVSFSADVQPIFDASCVTCHGAGGSGGLDLRAGSSHSNLVGVTSPTYQALRVDPGAPDASVLFDKVSGGGVYGGRMPLGQPPLPSASVETIRRWIADGAIDD